MDKNAEQAVAEVADAQQAAGTEAAGAQAETPLDELLDSFNANGGGQASSQSEQSPKTAADSNLAAEVEALKKTVSELREESAGKNFQEEFDRQAAELSEGLDVDPEVFKNALYGRVARDQKLADAYENRSKDPGTWRQIQQALKGEFAQSFPAKSENIDMGMTQDREAVAAFTRGQTSTAPRGDQPSEDEIAKMSDKEFNDWQRKNGAPMFS